MIDEPRAGAGTAAYRGFLFSDMRGFTAFAERHGNAAAAAAVGRFLEIARAAIARHDGAEMKTEGDAIHAVFPSASTAVLAGLEIVDAAAEVNARNVGRPLDLGVGVHAGEAVETAEGYIGRAVNIASRLCAAAGPGEVLVSSTVKGIMQSSIQVGFIPKGRRRLKGIQDPIIVYAVTRDMTARAPRRLPRTALLGAGAAVLAVGVVAVLAGSQLFTGGPSRTPDATETAPSLAPTDQTLVPGPLDVGDYSSGAFQPPLRFHIPDPGWTANRDLPDLLGLIRDDAPRGSLYFLRVGAVIANPCTDGDPGTETGPADLITDLEGLDHLDVSTPVPVQVGGFDGQQVDITVSNAVLAACGGLVGGDAALFRMGDELWRATAGERFRLISVDVEGRDVTIVLSTDWTQIPSVQELESLLEVGGRVLDSVEF